MANEQLPKANQVVNANTGARRKTDHLAPDAIVNYLRDMSRDIVREEIARALGLTQPRAVPPVPAVAPVMGAPVTQVKPDKPRRGRKANLRDPRIPPIGAVLVREYAGRKITAEVVDGGFASDGQIWPSLSAIATAATGLRTSGFAFFRLKTRARTRRS